MPGTGTQAGARAGARARHLEAAAVDDALDLCSDSLLAARLIGPARRATDKARLAAMPKLENASSTLVAVAKVMLELFAQTDGVLDIASARAAIEEVASRDEVAATMTELVPDEDSAVSTGEPAPAIHPHKGDRVGYDGPKGLTAPRIWARLPFVPSTRVVSPERSPVFAQVTSTHLPEEQLDKLVPWTEQQLPAVRQAPGFCGLYLLADRASGKVMTIALWDTEDDLRRNDQARGARVRNEARADLGVAPPPVERYEVVLQA